MMASSETGRASISACRCTRATRCSGTRSPRSPSSSPPPFPFAVRAPLKVTAIFIACAAPLLFGWLAYEERWIAGPGANYGELITPPRALGGPLERLRGKWVLVTFDNVNTCADACERKLYIVRQVRRAQGENAA